MVTPGAASAGVATAMALGIPAQGVIGGITVLTQLNPFVVALHFLLSMVLITLAVWLVRSAYRVNREPVRPLTAAVVTFTFVAMWVAVWLGTMTTGSGPHAGDLDARRTGWDIVAHRPRPRVRRLRRDRRHRGARSGWPAVARWCCCWGSRCSRRRSVSPSTTWVCRSAWSPLHLLGAALSIAARGEPAVLGARRPLLSAAYAQTAASPASRCRPSAGRR